MFSESSFQFQSGSRAVREECMSSKFLEFFVVATLITAATPAAADEPVPAPDAPDTSTPPAGDDTQADAPAAESPPAAPEDPPAASQDGAAAEPTVAPVAPRVSE